jgi:hypothetical protein
MEIFRNRKTIIATKHQKEQVIAPILERELGVNCFTDKTFDTDVLGTFTGEVERVLDPISTVREKCLSAMRANNCDLGIASEGSFGPHPTAGFIHANDELLIFIDTKHNLEITVRELSTFTNFNGKQIKTQEELFEFADQVGFPSHGLILKKSKNENKDIHKGITHIDVLKKSFNYFFSTYHSVYVETDMRAMYNPTRMSVIEKATQKLAQKIKSTCPKCKTPGFGITEAKKGLECNLCGLPTNSTLSFIYTCQQCEFKKEEMYPNKKTTEDPTYCNYCNP